MKNAFKRLVIDTATPYLYLSLIIGDIEVGSVYQEGDHNHSVTIIPMLSALLEENDLQLKDLDQIIVGIGPGSYTGVRIGVSIAKMIGYLNQVEVYTISSLILLASSSNHQRMIPYVDARRGNAFMSLIEQRENTLFVVEDDVLMNATEFIRKSGDDAILIKSGKPKIEKILSSNVFKRVENIHDLVPNYLQITEAERHLRSS
ncbi:MAG: tRNA (adenosine(37)-N6)-threonylcarbamoyltransferase complex dimerization subunit type 1 TsaB [Firmicutes bacterium]|nr:tRNA (adenosine(37)-N6)-threonylcarbamoyltransferase complex dimerization subunit type 1 TsaB [Bacillota bacterium]